LSYNHKFKMRAAIKAMDMSTKEQLWRAQHPILAFLAFRSLALGDVSGWNKWAPKAAAMILACSGEIPHYYFYSATDPSLLLPFWNSKSLVGMLDKDTLMKNVDVEPGRSFPCFAVKFPGPLSPIFRHSRSLPYHRHTLSEAMSSRGPPEIETTPDPLTNVIYAAPPTTPGIIGLLEIIPLHRDQACRLVIDPEDLTIKFGQIKFTGNNVGTISASELEAQVQYLTDHPPDYGLVTNFPEALGFGMLPLVRSS